MQCCPARHSSWMPALKKTEGVLMRSSSLCLAPGVACAVSLIFALLSGAWAVPRRLEPAPSAVDNPMKGLVPYAGMHPERFPHSLEFDYIPLAEVMRGPENFDWAPVERRLNAAAQRGCQSIFRVWLEYPGKSGGVPEFLLQQGVKLTRWRDGKTTNLTPDYSDERLVSALERFIAAFGQRYDGDARLGYLTAGLLGAWGEWHTFPREDLFAPGSTQTRVMDAFRKAFRKTRVLLRYPAGPRDAMLAANDQRPFGYHDDSFAWGTLNTGRPEDAWFYMTSLTGAGAQDKWRTQPIGGEIRPELWGLIFDAKPAHPKAQDFDECVRQTHVTWLMDSGLFREPPTEERTTRASAAVQCMGYDFHATEVDLDAGNVALTIRNQGVAPFYANWPAELAAFAPDGAIRRRWPVDWQPGTLMPGDTQTFRAGLPGMAAGDTIAFRVINPLPGGKGKPLRFANAAQDAGAPGWLILGKP
jgi:hypothetical protein